ncbi:MAG: hypothetical protein RL757_1057 [Bacteroidota bacterium]|jgi:2-(1,2-epoxy-1,2-dihydrophenyl)acetyl-CoA isomerase
MENQPESILQLEKSGGVLTIRFNRPKVFNSFNQPMCRAVQSALDMAAADSDIRCVVLTGNGKAFCAGQDLAEVTQPVPPTFAEILDDGYNPIVLKIRALQKPVIAAVNGVAAGAGANLALACDLVIACESASFIQAFVKIGLIPDNGGTFLLPRLVGLARATALMMTGEKVVAKDAQAMGMIYSAVADEKFEETVSKMSMTLANLPTQAIAAIKTALEAAQHNSLAAQLSLETQLQGKVAATEDYREGVTAFIEKRHPLFMGK